MKWDKVNFDCVIRYFCKIHLLRLYDTMLNFVENLLENERGPMNDQDLTKTDYDPDRSLVLIAGLSHFLTNFLQNLASCQTSFRKQVSKIKKKSDKCHHSTTLITQYHY
jgi:hypothetical protein